MTSTVFASLCDIRQYARAIQTLAQLRNEGAWCGDVALLCVDFSPDEFQLGELAAISVGTVILEHLDHHLLWKAWEKHPIRRQDDNRHYSKVNQWDKLQVFAGWCSAWQRVCFLDAGMNVCSPVTPLLDLSWQGRILAPQDGAPVSYSNVFRIQLDLDANPAVSQDLVATFDEKMLESPYFLNCCFIFDTALAPPAYKTMVEWMVRFPVMMCNEMGIMNLYFTFHQNVWTTLPNSREDGRYLFAWSDVEIAGNPPRDAFCLIKYPSHRL